MSRPAAPTLVTSRTHPLVQRMRRQARGRSADDPTCLLDGIHLVGVASELACALEAVLVDHGATNDELTALLDRLARRGVAVTYATSGVLDAASPVQSPSPIVALARVETANLEVALPAAPRPALIVLVDGVQDPGNLGAIVRTADAAGAHAVMCAGACADPFGWKSLRGSMGSALRIPIAVTSSLDDALDALAEAAVDVVALDARGGASIYELPWPSRVAVAVGREGAGLDDVLAARADALVSIPMREGVESLNAAVATGIALYAARQAAAHASRRTRS